MYNSQAVDPAKYGTWEEVLLGGARWNNNPSPLLLEIRELLDIPDRMKTYEVNLNALSSPRYEVRQSKDVVDHARKVLTKLVNVYGNKEEQ